MNKPLQIRYLPAAQADLREIFDYIASGSLPSARILLEKIDKGVQVLGSYPLIGTLPKDSLLQVKGYRYIIVSNYLVFYCKSKLGIEIRRVLHTKRNYRDML